MLDTTQETGPTFVYRKGARMSFADILSRPPGMHPSLDELTAKFSLAECEMCAEAAWESICGQHRKGAAERKAQLFVISTDGSGGLTRESILAGYDLPGERLMPKVIAGLSTDHDNHFKRRCRLDDDGLVFTRPQVGDSASQS